MAASKQWTHSIPTGENSMAKTPKPEPPKARNPIARVIKQIPQQVVPSKKKERKPKHRPNPLGDWADPFPA
ncbi:hypothetical protein MAIT1_00232 [Magnetofaba australis IT-1]|uniref:Uncharacterized protein n=2 Tax=Magnetofaba TaxID=1472292 RepID=A0A1Y2K8R7_9PROT|nr:hypothetical protein MAIT1_00232 [Magnetofaba australis IT-1]